jgi:hypothetical protein
MVGGTLEQWVFTALIRISEQSILFAILNIFPAMQTN